MKISYNWLKSYIDVDCSVEELSDILTDIGLEVEGLEHFETIKGGLKGVVVGKVLECEKHPDADRLHVTKVEMGDGKVSQIVCGAPNVAQGQTVLVASVGTKLYGEDEKEFEIKKAKIRGVASEGMICSEIELGIGDSHEGILVIDDKHKAGTKASDIYEVKSDYIFEIGLTPNRSDAISHFGIARDVAAALSIRNNINIEAKLPQNEKFNPQIEKSPIDIDLVELDHCPRYSGIYIKNIEVKESPEWIKNYLESVGLGSINNIVDITNFIMLEIGQPLHAFDAAKIDGNKVVVRKANKGKFTTLDGVERELKGSELMICNAQTEMCIAGVYGGLDSGVSENTTEIFLESATFDAVSVRKTSKLHGLKTDSSFRFERGADPNINIYAIERAIQLFSEVCPKIEYSNVVDAYPNVIKPVRITLKYDELNKVVGKEIPQEIVEKILNRLDFTIISKSETALEIDSPLYRVDVTREIDVVEEILRIYGYNSVEIPTKVKYSITQSEDFMAPKLKLKDRISEWFSARGLYEAMNNSLTKSEYYEKFKFLNPDLAVKIINPLSRDLEFMRQSLLPGLLENILLNNNYQQQNVRLFEFGREYYINDKDAQEDISKMYKEKEMFAFVISGTHNSENWKYGEEKLDLYSALAIVNDLLGMLNLNKEFVIETQADAMFSEGVIYQNRRGDLLAKAGKVHPRILKHFDIKAEVFYAEIDWELLAKVLHGRKSNYKALVNYQAVRRDLSLLIDKKVSFAELEKLAYANSKNLLREVNLFDVYEGDKIAEDKKSYAVSFKFQNPNGTMTDAEINALMDKIIEVYTSKLGAVLR